MTPEKSPFSWCFVPLDRLFDRPQSFVRLVSHPLLPGLGQDLSYVCAVLVFRRRSSLLFLLHITSEEVCQFKLPPHHDSNIDASVYPSPIYLSRCLAQLIFSARYRRISRRSKRFCLLYITQLPTPSSLGGEALRHGVQYIYPSNHTRWIGPPPTQEPSINPLQVAAADMQMHMI